MDLALAIKDLDKRYAPQGGRPGTHALRGVSLQIPRGGFFALLGPNGAGKSTLIGIITGLVNPTGGSAEIFGIDLAREPERARMQVGVVPQQLNFNIFEKVIDIVITQAGYYGIPRSVALPRAEQLLRDLGLYEKRHDVSRTLSGGMQRRLLIARALIHEPKLLVLDEPTAGVDVELRRSMWEYLERITKAGVTILLTTHYLEEAEQLAKYIAIINKGQIVAEGSLEQILALHKDSGDAAGYKGGKLEEVFLQLTKSEN